MTKSIYVFIVSLLLCTGAFAEPTSLMLGETHKYAYTLDSELVISMLPDLKKRGFNYLAIEAVAGKQAVMSNKLQRFVRGEKLSPGEFLDDDDVENIFVRLDQILEEYAQGKIKREDILPYWLRYEKKLFPGWFDLIDAARKERIKIVLYDPPEETYSLFNEREVLAFENLKKMIFNDDPDAKVIIYCGADHLSEKEDFYANLKARHAFSSSKTNAVKETFKTIGFYLDALTGGRNFAVDISKDPNTKNVDLTLDLNQMEKAVAASEIIKGLSSFL